MSHTREVLDRQKFAAIVRAYRAANAFRSYARFGRFGRVLIARDETRIVYTAVVLVGCDMNIHR